MTPTRVLVVDDSPLIRQILVDMLRKEPDLDVVGYARDGEEALLRIAELNPDVVTLDVEMPRLDGLGCLRELMATRPVPVVMVSTLTAAGTATTLEALSIGAVDFVNKPNNGSLTTLRGVREELVEKVRNARFARVQKSFRAPVRRSSAADTNRICLVASSTGGPRALTAFFEGLPQNFKAPILLVQHMPAGFIAPLAARLHEVGVMKVREARPGDRIEPGVALFAPHGKHMTVTEGGALKFDDGPTVHGVRPAADRLFASAAEAFGSRCVAAILSGMGRDGAEGALAIHKAGGVVLAESEETCTIFGMPKAAITLGAVDHTVSIDAMGEAMAEAAAGKVLNVR